MSTYNAAAASRESLLLKAEELGLEFAKNIGTEQLRDRVSTEVFKNMGEQMEPAVPIVNPLAPRDTESETAPKVKTRTQVRDEAMALVRFTLTVQNPQRLKVPSMVITVANDLIGQVTKVIPTSPEFYANGYHAPRCIVEMLKGKQYSHYREVPVSKGSKLKKTVLQTLPEFIITELPPLTDQQLATLAARQNATGSLDNND